MAFKFFRHVLAHHIPLSDDGETQVIKELAHVFNGWDGLVHARVNATVGAIDHHVGGGPSGGNGFYFARFHKTLKERSVKIHLPLIWKGTATGNGDGLRRRQMAFLYITEQGAVLKKAGRRLLVEKDEEKLLDIPASKIEGVLVFGNVQFTTQAVQLMFREGIEMGIFSRRGKLLGQLTSPATKNIDLRRHQYERHGDVRFSLSLARTIVGAKLTNGLAMVQGFFHNHPESALAHEIDRLKELCSKAHEQQDLQSLLGLEGAGAKIYFDAFGEMVLRSFPFPGRRRRPAPDPVNALLSVGYTLLHNEIESLLDGMGFDPYLGFYHQPRYGHATLASDLMEEFRAPLVDRLTLYVVNNSIFKEEDFFRHTQSGSMYLKDDPRKRYFVEYERFVTSPVNSEGQEYGTGYRGLFRRQAERLNRALSKDVPYAPYLFTG